MQEFDKKNKNIEAVEESDKTSEATNAEASGLGGVSKEILDKGLSSHTSSEDQLKAQADADASRGNLINVASKDNIVSEDTWGAINQQFKTPSAVTQADAYLKSQLGKIQSGKTSYSDQVRDMMSRIQNRDKFSYDVDSDPLFQQALASAMSSGKSAMQDTMGQAAALTGGYGSTYATSAANQAYNSFIEDAYNNFPQYYQTAMEAYQMEGDEMYRQLDMLNAADETEYGRMLNAYDVTSQYRNQMYNEAYQQHRDGISDAFASANLQINEHGQLVSDAATIYNANSEYANTLYEREYTKWADEVSQAMKYAEMLNSEYWNQKTFDQNDDHFYDGLTHQSEENKLDREHQSAENKANRDWQSAEALLERNWKSEEAAKERTFNAEQNALYKNQEPRNGFELSTTQLNAMKDANAAAGGGDAGLKAAIAVGEAMGIVFDDEITDIVNDALNTTKTGAISGFNAGKGDNFEVKVGEETFGVENHGPVTDIETVKKLNEIGISEGNAFVYDGQAYIRNNGGGYFKIGAKMGKNDDYNALKKALS